MEERPATAPAARRPVPFGVILLALPVAALVVYLLLSAGLENVRWSFSVAWPWWIIAAAVLLPALSAVLFYRRVRAELPGTAWITLVCCRLLATVALLLCCFRPQMAFERIIVTKSGLIILADNSKSMRIADTGDPRFEEVRGTLNKFVPTLNKDFRVHLYNFSSATTHLMHGLEDLEGIEPDGLATNIRRSIIQSVNEHKREPLAGVILFTDGIDNSGQSLTRNLEALQTRVFPVGVGSKLQLNKNFRDIVVTRLEGPKYAIVNNACELVVYLRNAGFANNVVTMRLVTAGGDVLVEKEIALGESGQEQREALSITPKEMGKLYVEATVPTQPAEKIPENNTQNLILSVISPKIRVLYVQGTVRPEYKWLFRALQRDANIEVLSLVRVAGSRFVQQGKVEEIELAGFPRDKKTLEVFDVVIISDLDATFLREELPNVVEVVREGKGFAMLGGDNSFGPGGYAATPVAEILPVKVGTRDMEKVAELFDLEVTAEGAHHPIFSGIAEAFISVERRPDYPIRQLRGFVEVLGAQPTATVLATHPQRNAGNDKLPVLAVQPFGKGRVAAFTAYSTARWRRRENVYLAFWGQLIRWLAQREIEEKGAEKGVIASSDKSSYEPGDRVRIFAQVRNEEGALTNRANVTAEVRPPSGRADSLAMIYTPPADGNYELSFEPSESGKYEITVAALEKTQTLGETTVAFQVGRPNLEFEELDLNDDGLRKIASVTGGRYFYLSNVNQLLLELVAKQEENRVTDYRKLYNLPALFFIFVGLLTLEWILRKKWRLV